MMIVMTRFAMNLFGLVGRYARWQRASAKLSRRRCWLASTIILMETTKYEVVQEDARVM